VAKKFGAIEETKTVKAGCGIRYDPEQLSDQAGFDFSKAAEFINEDESTKGSSSDRSNKGDTPATHTDS